MGEKTKAQIQEQLKKETAANASLKKQLADAKKAVTAANGAATKAKKNGAAPEISARDPRLGPYQPRFFEGKKVAKKTYFSHSPCIFIDKTYYDYVNNRAAKDMEQIKFDGHWYSTTNELKQNCIEQQQKFGKSIRLVTKANRQQFENLDKALRRTNYFKGPATSLTSKGESATVENVVVT